MAEISIGDTFGCPVIERFIEDLEKTINSLEAKLKKMVAGAKKTPLKFYKGSSARSDMQGTFK